MKNKSENIKVYIRIKPTTSQLINQSKRKQSKIQLSSKSKNLSLIQEQISDSQILEQQFQKENAAQNLQIKFDSPLSSIAKVSIQSSSKQKEQEFSNYLKNSVLNTKMRINKNSKEDIVIEKVQKNSLVYLKNDKIFEFEQVFDQTSKNIDIFNQIILPNFDFILKGNNFSVFMYGQTNSGKTYTMKGNKTKNQSKNINKNSVRISDIKKSIINSKKRLENFSIEDSLLKEKGIIQQTLKKLFERLENKKNCNYRIKVFYYEIYNEKIYDLLSEKQQSLKVQENKQGQVLIQNIQQPYIKNYQEALKIFQEGENRRKFASTKWNHNSSRSHVIFSIQIEIKYKSQILKSYFPTITMADLAGSESIGDQKQFSEGGNINKSLLALTTVIKKLNKKQDYIAFRESKLTRILKPFLSGDSRTCVICTINPLKKYEYESLNTLRFGISAGGVTFNLKDSNLDISQNKENNEEFKQNYIKEISQIQQENLELQEKYEKLDLQFQFAQEQLKTIKNELDAKNQLLEQLENQNENTYCNQKELQEQLVLLNQQNKHLQNQLKMIKEKNVISDKSNQNNVIQQQLNQQKEDKSELETLKDQNKILLKKIHQLNFQINFGRKKSIRNLAEEKSQKKIQINTSKQLQDIKKFKKQIKRHEQREENYLIKEKKLRDLLNKKNDEIKKMRSLINQDINSENWFKQNLQ